MNWTMPLYPSQQILPMIYSMSPSLLSSFHLCPCNALLPQSPKGILSLQAYAGHSPILKPSKGLPLLYTIIFKAPLTQKAFFLLLTYPSTTPPRPVYFLVPLPRTFFPCSPPAWSFCITQTPAQMPSPLILRFPSTPMPCLSEHPVSFLLQYLFPPKIIFRICWMFVVHLPPRTRKLHGTRNLSDWLWPLQLLDGA